MADAVMGATGLHGLQRSRWTPQQVTVVAICTLINALDGMDVFVMSYVAPAMANAWGISFQGLGVVFSAGLAGMMIGCVLVSPIADVIGRRPVILAALAVMTAGAIGTGVVNAIGPFIACRVVTGIGIGTLLASIAALVSEYAPAGRRSLAIGIFQAGYPVGAVLTGVGAIWAIPAFGWQATLIGAGLASAVVLPIAAVWLPESISFLEKRRSGDAAGRVRAAGMRGSALPLGRIFAGGLWRSTVLLWVATFLGFGVLYFVSSWIPKLSVEAGLDASRALWAGSLFNLGGLVGALSIGWLATSRDISRLIRTYMATGAALLVIFSVSMPLELTLLTAVGLGLTLQGGFSGFYSLAAQMYEPEVRSSGIGWAIGIGRGGAIIGPLVGGVLLEQKMPLWAVFTCFAVPMAVCGLLASLVRHRADLA